MSSVLTRQYTNIAGLVVLVYDQIITWDEEWNLVWRSRDRTLQVMFFLGRYWALAFQIANLTVTHPYVLKTQAIDCHKWFGFQGSALGVLSLNLQLILMLRVYALYERSTKMAGFLIGWLVFYTIVTMVLLPEKFVPSLKFDSNCMLVEPPKPEVMIAFSLICALDQCILWGLTANKYRDAIRRGWSTNPIVRLAMRDTSWSCLAVCILFIGTLPYTLMVDQFVALFHSLFCSLASVLTCRTILNLRGLNNPSGPSNIDITTAPVEFEQTDPNQLE